MIIDQIKNASLYYGLGTRIADAFKFLQETELTKIRAGKYELNEDMYAIAQSYKSKPMIDGKWEAHRKYIDIQFIADEKK